MVSKWNAYLPSIVVFLGIVLMVIGNFLQYIDFCWYNMELVFIGGVLTAAGFICIGRYLMKSSEQDYQNGYDAGFEAGRNL